MIKEEKIRALIALSEEPLNFVKENYPGHKDGKLYNKAVQSLIVVEEIKKDLGYIENKIQKGTSTKNRKLF